MLLRIIIVLIAAFMLWRTSQSGKTLGSRAVNSLVWIGVMVLAIFPTLAHRASAAIGIGENLNTLIFLGFIVIFIALQRIARVLEKTQTQITSLVERDTLTDFKNKNS